MCIYIHIFPDVKVFVIGPNVALSKPARLTTKDASMDIDLAKVTRDSTSTVIPLSNTVCLAKLYLQTLVEAFNACIDLKRTFSIKLEYNISFVMLCMWCVAWDCIASPLQFSRIHDFSWCPHFNREIWNSNIVSLNSDWPCKASESWLWCLMTSFQEICNVTIAGLWWFLMQVRICQRLFFIGSLEV